MITLSTVCHTSEQYKNIERMEAAQELLTKAILLV